MHPNLVIVGHEKDHKTAADRVTLTEEGMHYANPRLLVVFKDRNETIHLRILGVVLRVCHRFDNRWRHLDRKSKSSEEV